MYFVYLLQCADKSIYTGITNDLIRRFLEHKNKKGGAYTASHGAKKIVYAEALPTKSAALKREAEIKSWRRSKKLGLINLKMDQIEVVGGLPDIILNKENIYEGNLAHYFQWIFFNAKNLNYPYHNFRHLFRAMWLCHQACVFYGEKLTRRQKRNLLIAAAFHDFNHVGKVGSDRANIEQAVKGLKEAITLEDKAYFDKICDIIRTSEFPHKIESKHLSLVEKILRDADLAQALDPAWVQEVVFGLAKERGTEPIEILRGQVEFLANLEFGTEWARQIFPRQLIEKKISEVNDFLKILRQAL